MGEYHARNEWGGRAPSAGRLGQVRYVVIHHTASDGEPFGFDAQRWRALEAGEVRNGYSSLAYHFGFTPSGACVESRGWGQRGAATGGTAPNGRAWNDTSVAFVLDGYYHPPVNDQPTDAAVEAMADWIVVGVYLGFIAPDFEVWAHRNASRGTKWASACNGDTFYPRVNGFASIAAIAHAKIDGAGGAIPAQPTPAQPPRCVQVASRRILKRGSGGVTVRTLQNLLRARGFDPGPSDGVFGPATEGAVRCFQTAAGLTVDGIVGPATWAALGA